MPEREKKVGVIDGKLYPCPRTPNCVSTMSPKDDEKHYIEPFTYDSTQAETVEKLIKIITSIKRTKILKQTENYVHAVFSTALMKFKDDVEFLIDDTAKIVHFRSASRVGKSDFGVNRKRMEKIRKMFLKS